MDSKQVILWIAAAAARGVAWVLAAKLGYDATEASTLAGTITASLAALVIAGISIYSSIKGRKAVLAQEPPVK